MIRSMTGFAGGERQYSFGRLTWELRSVNHRYLEIGFRVPEEFRMLEPEIRRILGEFLSRGKIDATLKYAPAAGVASSSLELNRELAKRLLALHEELQDLSGLKQDPDLRSLMRWSGMVEERAPDPQPLHQAALELLAEAAAGLQAARGREGEQMDAAIRERLQTITDRVVQVRSWLPEIRDGLRQKLLTRIADLQQPLDPGRLEQEVAPPALRQALARRRVSDVRKELESIVRELFASAHRNRIAIKLIDRCGSDHPELASIFYERGRLAQLGLLERYLAARIRNGHFKTLPDAAVAARFMIETIMTWAVHIEWDPAPQTIDPCDAEETVVHFLLGGLLEEE